MTKWKIQVESMSELEKEAGTQLLQSTAGEGITPKSCLDCGFLKFNVQETESSHLDLPLKPPEIGRKRKVKYPNSCSHPSCQVCVCLTWWVAAIHPPCEPQSCSEENQRLLAAAGADCTPALPGQPVNTHPCPPQLITAANQRY